MRIPKFAVCGLTLSWWRSLSYRNQLIDLSCKSVDWFLYDCGLCNERVKESAWLIILCSYLLFKWGNGLSAFDDQGFFKISNMISYSNNFLSCFIIKNLWNKIYTVLIDVMEFVILYLLCRSLINFFLHCNVIKKGNKQTTHL